VVFRRGSLFDRTLRAHSARVGARLEEFFRVKLQDPLARFGKLDQHFTGDGPLAKTGLLHAHLTHDISLIYRRHGRAPTYIDLYAVASHDELGTGQPANRKRQKINAALWDKQEFQPFNP
jgi:mRNA-degrading endonuclease YafQ of YafQ-DinJ toxin-antitoxin module